MGECRAPPGTVAQAFFSAARRERDVAARSSHGPKGGTVRTQDVEMRVDGDAIAIWLSQGSIGPAPSNVPVWANAIGFGLVIVAVGFTVLGSLTFFGWLFRTLGWL